MTNTQGIPDPVGRDGPPARDRKTQQRLARGEAAALGELYDQYAPLVYGLALRVLDDEEAADTVLTEVFSYLWQHPDAYEPKRGPLRSWLANMAHKHAVRRLRWSAIQAKAEEGGAAEDSDGDTEARIRDVSAAARADYIVTAMPAGLRAALELAYFKRHDYRRTAADLNVSEAEARRRLRLGLQLLSTAYHPPTPDGRPA
ncbi:sigma-70 family RNA polymerase sigma factor [Streptomyces sp. A7024]|uniref:Sigma-70 family RNA polymerase sigma factor n=1 Tax=Streptomyces coryli TaxID=1128680 RepID=A0A6G4UEH3_9ACTN|nr:sigma-70 family RNA polymerase sigma factor [Streptomyces coryli]NGN69928.1 sigma-70 family RNA polymerase sigma factor [Streptomyces coryli]